jgi:tRNA A37 threonylcarbamoyladenosine dehydratase
MKIACIGCGGIGSYFAEHIDNLIEINQIDDDFTFFDDDTVEKKNIIYQNFDPGDVDSTKVQALELKYFNINFTCKRCSVDDLSDFDLVVLCADNNLIRREAYKNFIENKIPFIDSRANGKVVGIFSSDTKDYLKTINDSNESQSCQNPFQIEKQEIEYGNVIVAASLAQVILNYKRKNKLPNDLLLSF